MMVHVCDDAHALQHGLVLMPFIEEDQKASKDSGHNIVHNRNKAADIQLVQHCPQADTKQKNHKAQDKAVDGAAKHGRWFSVHKVFNYSTIVQVRIAIPYGKSAEINS